MELRRQSWFRCLLPVVVCAGALILVYWKLVLSSQYTFADSPDMVNQVLPWMAVQAREWQSGHVPLWDPYHWAGQSLIGQSQPGVLHPVTILAALAPLRDGLFALKTLHWQFVFIHFLAALCGYLLCRELRCSLPASLAGAAVWTLGGYAGSTDWVQMLNSALPAPLALLFYFRYTRTGHLIRNAAWSGAMLGLGLARRAPPGPGLHDSRARRTLAL
ncbi:MAG: hypothetical protein QM757_33140 [Paludibaculum sp.]